MADGEYRQLDALERWARRAVAGAALWLCGSVLLGLWQGRRRPKGRTTGRGLRPLPLPVYLLSGAAYLSACVSLWRPLALARSPLTRGIALLVGSLLYFPGVALMLWGQRALGEMYNVSSVFGVQLYAGHRLVTHGPFAHVRHPMYLGALLAGLGALLLHRVWTMVFLVAHFPILVLRARREEEALAAQFGAEWEAYCRRVPGWVPRWPRD